MAEFEDGFCFLSGSKAEVAYEMMSDTYYVKSEACGYYALVDSVSSQIERIKKETGFAITQSQVNCARKTLEVLRERGKGVLPVWNIRENVSSLQEFYDKNRKPREYEQIVLSFDDIASEPVDHSHKAQDFLNCVAQNIGKSKAFSSYRISPKDRVWARIVDEEELFAVIKYLREKGYVSYEIPPGIAGLSQILAKIYEIPIQLTVPGWEYIKESTTYPNTNKVFIATAFNWESDVPFRQNDAIEAIKRACARLGYQAETVSQNHTSSITDRIIADIRQSNFVICELTHNNRGAYFEAGFARGLGRHVFHLVHKDYIDGEDKEGKKVHFDLQQVMYRSWETVPDLEQKLTDWVEATVGRYR